MKTLCKILATYKLFAPGPDMTALKLKYQYEALST